MIKFIDENKSEYGTQAICRVLPIAPSTYYRAKDLESCPDKRSLRSQHDDFYISESGASGRTASAATVRVKSGSK